MSIKRTRRGSTTADTGKDEGAEHVVMIAAGNSTAVPIENEVGSTDSHFEWEKTANGFKRRIVGAERWKVCIFYFVFAEDDSLPGTYFSVWFLPPQMDAQSVQGLRRRLGL